MKDFAVQPREWPSVSDTTSPWGQAVRQTAPEAAPAEPDLTPSRPLYDGRLGELYAIYLRHLVLMLLTLGWSRFWGRTRIRRYLWNHFAILGDRFEYRGRGRELLIGFLLAVLMLAVWGGLMWLVWIYLFHEKPFASFGLFDIFWLSVALIGFPLAYVGQYAGLRYRLSRTRWRGIRCALAGSAWGYGATATFLVFSQRAQRPAADAGRVGEPRAPAHLQRPLRHPAVRLCRQFRRHLRPLSRLLLPEHHRLAGGGGHHLRRDRRHGRRSRHHVGRHRQAVHAVQPAHRADRGRHPARRLCRVQPADPAAALLVAGLSLPLSRLAQPRRPGAVRHGDLDPPDVGLPGAELPDRRADPRARLAVGPAPHAEADRRRAVALRRARRRRHPPAGRSAARASARAFSTCST